MIAVDSSAKLAKLTDSSQILVDTHDGVFDMKTQVQRLVLSERSDAESDVSLSLI
jgi:hypothetical protein